MILRFWNRAANAATASLAVLVMLFMVSCSSTHTGSGGLPTHLPDIQLSGSPDTPPHSMASYEYPFDSNGRYVSDWAAEGERRAGRAASATSDDTSKWSRSHGAGSSGTRKSSSSAKVTTSSRSGSTAKSGSTSRKVAESDSKPVSSKSSSRSESQSRPQVAHNDDKPTGTNKPAIKRPAPSSDDVASNDKPKSSTSTKARSSSSKGGRKYTVKSGDTLSRIAANYGTSVAKIKAANGMGSDFLSIGKVLRIP